MSEGCRIEGAKGIVKDPQMCGQGHWWGQGNTKLDKGW